MLNIFTLTWNGLDKITKLKDSFLPSLEGIDYKWFIKDNDSKDNTFEVVSEWGSKVHIVKYKNNLQNFSQGMNFLYNESQSKDSDDILLLNNDVILKDKNSITNMLQMMKVKNVGCVGARLLYTDTNKLQHAGVVFDNVGNPMHFRAKEESDKNAMKNRYFQVVTGAVLMLKGDTFKNVSKNKSGNLGMDENYHWAFDDVDLCLSVKYKQGKDIIYCGNTEIYHEESASLKKNPANIMFMKHNINYLREKWNSSIVRDLDSYKKNVNHNLMK